MAEPKHLLPGQHVSGVVADRGRRYAASRGGRVPGHDQPTPVG